MNTTFTSSDFCGDIAAQTQHLDTLDLDTLGLRGAWEQFQREEMEIAAEWDRRVAT